MELSERNVPDRVGDAAPVEAESACVALEAVLHARAPHLGASARFLRRLLRGMAAELDLEATERAALDWAARVRDVGMVWLPDELLEGGGALSPEGWAQVSRHPVLGADVLAAIPALSGVSAAVRSHHERWDGDGYPDGLGDSDVPLASRVIAVGDAFVAMAYGRPQRPGMGAATALDQVHEGRGSQFDPKAVDALRAALAAEGPRRTGPRVRPRRSARAAGGTSDLPSAVEHFDAVPALAPAHERLAALCQRAAPPGEMAGAIEDDVGLTVAVLSAAQGAGATSKKTTNIPDAVARLGPPGVLAAIEDLPLSEFPWRSSRQDAALQRFRVHAVAVARAVARLADETDRKDRDDLLVAGLLHDVGKLVLERARSRHAAAADGRAVTPEGRVLEEQRELGLDHAALGGLLASRWGLPKSLGTTIAEHHSAEDDSAAALVRLADMLAHHAQGDPVERALMLRLGYACGLHPRTLRTVLFDLPHAGGSQRRRAEPTPLTAQETKIIRGLADGKVYAEIARDVGLAVSTVRSHLHNAYAKLGVVDRAQAVILATDQGWI